MAGEVVARVGELGQDLQLASELVSPAVEAPEGSGNAL